MKMSNAAKHTQIQNPRRALRSARTTSGSVRLVNSDMDAPSNGAKTVKETTKQPATPAKGRGGARIGSGRPKGRKDVTSRMTAARKMAALASSDGVAPLEYMLGVLRDPTAPVARRDDMAKAAAPYMHAKLASVEHTGKDGGAIEVRDIRLVGPE